MTLQDLIKLKTGEKIIMKLRRHILIFFGQLFLIFVLAFAPFGAGFIINNVRPEWFISPVARSALILLVSAYYLNIWLFALAIFVDYYLDAWVVTDSRVIDIQQDGLFSRTVAELELSRIQDITSDIKGIIPSMLNYGNVHIQTAGETKRFKFEQVPNADHVRNKLMALVEKNRVENPIRPQSNNL